MLEVSWELDVEFLRFYQLDLIVMLRAKNTKEILVQLLSELIYEVDREMLQVAFFAKALINHLNSLCTDFNSELKAFKFREVSQRFKKLFDEFFLLLATLPEDAEPQVRQFVLIYEF